MRRLPPMLFALLALCAVLGPWAPIVGLRLSTESVPAAVPAATYWLASGASVAVAVVAAAMWRFMQRRIMAPARTLARDLRTLTQARRVDRELRPLGSHALEDLPGAVATVVDELRGARREMVRAMASVAARTELDKSWLEHILLELVPQGVVVCNFEHQLLLYNQAAARLFANAPAFGLGRPLSAVVTMAPLEHALERLELTLKAGKRGGHLGFISETVGGATLMQGRMTLVLDGHLAATGYALSLEDVSADIEHRRAAASMERAITQQVRGPLGSLRAAAETLGRAGALSAERREVLQDVIIAESATLSELVEQASASSEMRGATAWPLSEVHSHDLLSILSDRLSAHHGISLVVEGEGTWVSADSHVLLTVLLDLAVAIAKHADAGHLVACAGDQEHRSFIELHFEGTSLPSGELETWLDYPVSLLPELRMREALELHGSEPWIGRDSMASGMICVHVPLQSAKEPETGATATASNPERYDFNLMYAQGLTGNLGKRRLSEMSFVVFDTETTGLRPAAGDRIISIAGIRVANGRVLPGESFNSLVNPGRSIPKQSIRFHGITDEAVADADPVESVLPRFHAFAGDSVLVAHNAAFDMRFLKLSEARCAVSFDNAVVDTLLLSLLLDGEDEDHSLDGICERLDVQIEGRHSALGDASATAHVLIHMLERLRARDLHTFNDLMRATEMEDQLKARAHSFTS